MLNNLQKKAYKFLRWSEKWMKTDMIYMASSGFWLSFGQLLISLSGFFVAIAFANLLPREIYGNYKFIISFIGVLLIPTLEGLPASYVQAVARGYEGSYLPIVKTRILWGLWGSLASLGLAIYYYLNGNLTLAGSFVIIAVFIPFLQSFIETALLNGRKQFKLLTKYNILKKVSYVVVMVGVLFLTDNILYILLAYLAVNTFVDLILFIFIFIKYKPNNKVDEHTISYGKHLSLMTIISTIASNVDKIILFHFMGAQKVAIYSFSLVLPESIKGVIKNLSVAAMPKMSASSPEVQKKTLNGKILRFMVVMIPLTVVYIITAPLLYKLFFPTYLDSVFYSQIFALSIILTPQVLYTTYLKAQMKKKQLYIINLFTPSIKILLCIILAPFYGVMGLILAVLISRVANFFALLVLFKKS